MVNPGDALVADKHCHVSGIADVPSSRSKGVFGHTHVRRRADPVPWVVALVQSMISRRLRAVLAQSIDERRGNARVDCDAAMVDGVAMPGELTQPAADQMVGLPFGYLRVGLPPRVGHYVGLLHSTSRAAGRRPRGGATTQSASSRVWPMPRRVTVCAGVRTAPGHAPNGAHSGVAASIG